MVRLYKDRKDAGRQLAKHLGFIELNDPLVLAIPRGGVIVGNEVASALGADLDVVMAKKVGAPFNPEFAIAAVDLDGNITVLSDWGLAMYTDYIREEAQALQREIQAKLEYYRNGNPAKEVKGRDVIVVDDGLATGLTALAALKYVRGKEPDCIVLAVPVAPSNTLALLEEYADVLVCPFVPQEFYAVGQWYLEFDQTSDDEVRQIMAKYLS
ncbi:MAG: phosphoribosyltransferase family protein [Bacillota bacterium]